MEKKQNTIFYFMPGSLLACVFVNSLWPQQLPGRTSAKCWPPPWPLLWQWSVPFFQSITGVFKVTLTLSSVGHKYLDAVHHLGQDRVPCQDVNTIKRNVWERISGFQTLLGAQQNFHTAKNHRTYLVSPAAWRVPGGFVDRQQLWQSQWWVDTVSGPKQPQN